MPSRWLLPALTAALALAPPAAAAKPDCAAMVNSDGEERCQEFSNSEFIYGTRRLCPSDLVPTPDWKGPEVSAPPLADEAARQASREVLERMGFDIAEWNLALTQIQELCEGRWYFMTHWRPKTPHPSSFQIAVNMDGKAIVNSHRPDGPGSPDGKESALAHFERSRCREGEQITARGCATIPVPARRIAPSYPEQARKDGVSGNVILTFMVRKDGSLGAIQVVREEPEGYGFAEEAIRNVKAMTWKPAHQRGDPFDYMMTRVFDWQRD